MTYENNGPDNWSNAFATIELKAGENRIRFAPGQGSAEIDCIDLVPTPLNLPSLNEADGKGA